MVDKKALALILTGGKPFGKDDSDEDEMESKDKGSLKSKGSKKYTEMAEEMISAIADEDAEALGKALKAFIDVCTLEED